MAFRPIFWDPFDYGSGTNLESLTPRIGTSYTRVVVDGSGSFQTETIDGGIDGGSAGLGDGLIYLFNGTYPTANYQVSVTQNVADNSDDYNYLILRYTNTNNFYALEYNEDTFRMWKKVGGTFTALAADLGSQVNDGDTVAFSANGTTLRAYVNGVLEQTVTDSALTSVGVAGMGAGAVRVSGADVSGQGWGNFLVTDLSESVPTKYVSNQINWDNPLTQGLVFAMPNVVRPNGRVQDLVTGISGTAENFTGTEIANTPVGPSLQYTRSPEKRINFGYNKSWDISGDQMSIEAWVKLDGSSLTAVVDYGNGSASENYSMLVSAATIFMQYHNGSGFIQPSAANFWGVGEYIHAVITMERQSATQYRFRFYRNGEEFATSTQTNALITANTNNLYVGWYNSGSQGGFAGTVPDVKIWRRTLSPTEVKQLHQDSFQIYRPDDQVGIFPSGGGGVGEKSHTTDALIRKPTEVAHTTDALTRRAAVEKTHTTNALVRKANTKTHTTNARVRKSVEKTHTTSANVKKAFTVAHTTDVYLKKQIEKTHTTDAYIRKATERTHTTDANLKKEDVDRVHTTDANLKTVDIELSHTTDALLLTAFDVLHTTDANLKKETDRSHTTDANTKTADLTKTHTTDALLRAAIEADHTTDANTRKFFEVAHTADANVRREFEVGHTTDTQTRFADVDTTHTTDAFLLAVQTATHTTDANLRKLTEKTHTTSAVTRKSRSVSHTTDAEKRQLVQTKFHTTDARITAGFFQQLSHSTDATIKKAGEGGAPSVKARFGEPSVVMKDKLVTAYSDTWTYDDPDVQYDDADYTYNGESSLDGESQVKTRHQIPRFKIQNR